MQPLILDDVEPSRYGVVAEGFCYDPARAARDGSVFPIFDCRDSACQQPHFAFVRDSRTQDIILVYARKLRRPWIVRPAEKGGVNIVGIIGRGAVQSSNGDEPLYYELVDDLHDPSGHLATALVNVASLYGDWVLDGGWRTLGAAYGYLLFSEAERRTAVGLDGATMPVRRGIPAPGLAADEAFVRHAGAKIFRSVDERGLMLAFWYVANCDVCRRSNTVGPHTFDVRDVASLNVNGDEVNSFITPDFLFADGLPVESPSLGTFTGRACRATFAILEALRDAIDAGTIPTAPPCVAP